ncbi:sulfite exporter TauE/SafE family protein [Desulfococcus sp.]|uniref:sulfite exporter TauE/SafE family protein n=1 Tax=Desulfococcus sp. TaxID=2025834 RepID=UPI003593ECCF
MQKRTISLLVMLMMGLALVLPLVTATTAHADKLADAIAATPQGTEKGQIDPAAKPGFLGIPGAPDPGMLMPFLWAIWVGWIFSTVGAFGGVMAGVGHITVFGLGAYAKSFADTNNTLNKMITDSIRVSNQWLVGLSSLVSSITYARQKRLVTSLGLFLGGGALLATYLISQTAGKVSFSQYQGWFGLCVFLIGAFMIYDMSPKGQAKKQAAKAAVKAFEETVKCKGDICEQGVKTLKWSITKTEISFFGQTFSFNPLWALFGGFIISAIASFIGVGGGFLYVPFLTSVAGLPMFVVAGTSALAVLISMVTSIFQFMTMKGVPIFWPMIGVELIGVFVGSILGPKTGKYIPEKVLKWIFLILAFYIGLRYTLRGFFAINI